MDISPAAAVGAVVQMQQAQTHQEAQLLVMKKAMDLQGAGLMTLLQGVAGNLPLATSGPVGTQVNVMA